MKQLTLKCTCGKTKLITGKDVDEILDKIDISGWQDCPDEKGYNANCPDCLKKFDDSLLGEPE